MAISEPRSDTSRAIQHDPDQSWPTSVILQVGWQIGGVYRTRTHVISADEFFGRGPFGAPLPGDAVINTIEIMRRAGPPPPMKKLGPPIRKKIPKRNKNAKRKTSHK